MEQEQVATVEQLLSDLEAAFSRNDVEAIVALFAPDATIESYLVSRVFNRTDGVCQGRAEIRELALALSKRGRPWGGHEPPIIRGNTVAIVQECVLGCREVLRGHHRGEGRRNPEPARVRGVARDRHV